jgi:hypothetical protein
VHLFGGKGDAVAARLIREHGTDFDHLGLEGRAIGGNEKNLMTLVKLDRDMLIADLYMLRAQVPADSKEAKQMIADLVELISKAPLCETGANYPRMRNVR